MLGEPERTQLDLNFVLFGIPVRVHPFFWIVPLFLGMSRADPLDIVSWLMALFISILFHELGHATVMRAYGFHPWIVLHAMGGLASYDPSSGTGRRRMTPWRDILVSSAGPLAGFLLAAAIVGSLVLAGHGNHVSFGGRFGIEPKVDELDRVRLELFINQVLRICTFWGLVNLLPVFPLDGGQIARELCTMANPTHGLRGSLKLSFITAVFAAAVGAVLLQSIFMGVFFGYLAYGSYTMLQAESGRDRW